MFDKQLNSEEPRFLTKEEELELGKAIQLHFKAKEELENSKVITRQRKAELEKIYNDGKVAIDILVKANMGLVYDRAKIFKLNYPKGPEFEDLVQEGTTGLMTAVHKYDPDRNNKFSTVAYYWIAQAVGRGVNKTGRLVRLPENRINDYSKIMKLLRTVDTENMTPAEIDDFIMKEMNISKADLRNIFNAAATPASLNKVVSSESGNSKELIDFVSEGKASQSSENNVIKNELNTLLQDLITKLPEINKDVILSVYNILDVDNALTPEQVRQKYDIQPFKFKKIQNSTMKELRHNLTQSGYSFTDFLDNI